MRELGRRYAALDKRARAAIVIGGIAALYLFLLYFPLTHDYLHKKMPLGVVVIGVITGTVTSLLAVGLILIYRSNRFINFAYGSMGSLIGAMAVGMYLQHHWSYWVIMPLGVLGGVIVGALTEVLIIRRFANSSRLILTVAS